jgi:hypothetical protein
MSNVVVDGIRIRDVPSPAVHLLYVDERILQSHNNSCVTSVTSSSLVCIASQCMPQDLCVCSALDAIGSNHIPPLLVI